MRRVCSKLGSGDSPSKPAPSGMRPHVEPWAAPHPPGTETKGGVSPEETDPNQAREEAAPGASAVRNFSGGLRSQESAHSPSLGRECKTQPVKTWELPSEVVFPCAHVYHLFSWLLVDPIFQPSLESVLIGHVFSQNSCSFPGFRVCHPSSPPRRFPPGCPPPRQGLLLRAFTGSP